MTNLNPAAAPPPRPGRFLGLRLGGSRYGIPVTQVREIIVMCPVTEVPRMPAHIRGVINLRGTVVPVIGLRERFGMQALEDEARACIIVLQPLGSARPGSLVGAIVDAVDEVIALADADIGPPPEFGGQVDVQHISGIATRNGLVHTLLDVAHIFDPELNSTTLRTTP
jgi:purine-binding chemotaxis protein CheW